MDIFDNYTLRTVALGTGMIGAVSGALGAFAVLRKQSLLGDAVSHAALPGVALAFLFVHSREALPLVLGAAVAGWLGALLVMAIVRTTHIKYDSALGVMFSVFFGFGLMLLNFIERRNIFGASQAGLRNYIFGQAATMLWEDIVMMAVLGGLAILLLVAFWKEFKLLSFDADFGASIGLPMRLLDVLLTSLMVVAIVIGLQAVGAVLMSAMIIAPAAAARQWTDRLGLMVLLAALFGALAGVCGSVLSNEMSGPGMSVPPGPTIILSVSAIVVVSLLFAPNRGLVWNRLRERYHHQQLRLEAVLEDLYELSSQHEGLDHGHPVAVLEAMNFSSGGVRSCLKELEARGWARRTGSGEWVLTIEGRDEAERLERSRA